MIVDIAAVSRLLDDAAQTFVLPRFAKLSGTDIEAKVTAGDPEDIVTVVDQQVEAHLSRELVALLPSSAVVGEETVHHRPELIKLLASNQPLWVIDPIDGTKNFAAGDSGFGIMVGWVVEGHAQAAWVVLPARRQSFIAERGSGSFVNGKRIRVPPVSSHRQPRGAALVRYMPEGLGDAVTQALHNRFRLAPPSGCAAVEYTDILKGERDFVIYYRLLPWDHAAPALILDEAGGLVSHLDGERYTARSENQLTVVAGNPAVAATVRSWLEPVRGAVLGDGL